MQRNRPSIQQIECHNMKLTVFFHFFNGGTYNNFLIHNAVLEDEAIKK